MSGSADFIRNSPTQFQTSQRSAQDKQRKNLKWIYITILATFVFLVIFAGLAGFLYYLNIKLNQEIEAYNLKLGEQLEFYNEKIFLKIREYEIRVQALSNKIEDIGRKNATKPLQLSSETATFQRVPIQAIEEFPEIEDIEDNGLINKTNTRANTSRLSRKNATKHMTSPPTLIEHQYKSPPRSNLPIFAVGEDRAMGDEDDQEDEAENDEISEETDDLEEESIPVKLGNPSGLPLRNRRKRNAEFAGSGGGNLIDMSLEQSHNRNESNISESSKLSSQNLAFSSAQDAKTQNNNSTQSDDPGKIQILPKLANRRSSSSSSPSAKNLMAKSTSSSQEMVENTARRQTRSTVIAAHFGADSSKYSKSSHSYYDGNTHLRHPTGEYQDWRPSSWFGELNMDKHFALISGNIKVHTSGLYFVYAQVFYSDLSDVNGYEVYLNSQVVLQCITSTYSLKNVTTKSNTCFTGGVIKCQTGDEISVKTVDTNRRVMLEASRTFVGMFKIGDFQSLK